MAYQVPNFNYTLLAGADLSSAQYKALVVNNQGRAAVAGADVVIAGVLQNKPDASGKAATIQQSGITPGVYGAAVTAGESLETDGSGQFVPYTTGYRVGIALESGATGEIHPILLL